MIKGKDGKAVAGQVSARPDNGAPLGTPENPLRVSLVSFHGYAPAIVANGSSLKTRPGSIYSKPA